MYFIKSILFHSHDIIFISGFASLYKKCRFNFKLPKMLMGYTAADLFGTRLSDKQ